MGDDIITICTPNCPLCHQHTHLEVRAADWERWMTDGVLIQHAFPEMPANNRELIKTGLHPHCWDQLTSDE